ncbi:amidohydrolase family protein [Subtercola sp. RTI3]|uniref:amidohydrolase family protein n=1 Tax=Subtercola sp. RTI3 TaxID=3048639 RepID=UPI002B22EFC0|nr:amidohydrolase family protein [Subtercola sp. RTI3]MEA9986916.1 amidohydrolase family protein [Subtercola sp. RTI3]
MVYESAIDVDSIVALDTHVHVEVDDAGHNALPPLLVDAASKYFKAGDSRPTLDEIAALYRSLSMAAVVFTVDAERALGHPPNSSEEIAIGAARNNDALIPFGSVDPTDPAVAITKAKRLVEEFGVRGFKFHPTVQNFDPSDPRYFKLYGVISEYGLPAIFHTGQTGIGSGLPGGAGLRLSLSNPMLLDTVAAEFSHWKIVMAHPSVPWQDEAIAIATHKENVSIDLSGWSPKYFPPQLVRAADSYLKHKVLFGSDYPLIAPDRWLRDFKALDVKDEVRPLILKANAVRLLGLEKEAK